MKKPESYAQLSSLITVQFSRGMVTNAFLPKAQWEAEIAAGTLEYITADNGLLVFRKREGHRILSFWINSGFFGSVPAIPGQTAAEIAHREKDTALAEAIQNWIDAGFERLFIRQRMVCTAENGAENEHIRTACIEDAGTVRQLLNDSFSPLTGCLPTERQLLGDIEAGGVLLYERDRQALGLLHCTADQKRTELRHLCVTEDARGQGIGDCLVKAYHSRTQGLTRQVWVRADYLPAKKIYENNGYTPDGMTADVLLYRG